jgi:tRNA G18 (ribose-2'-O)-methylase SpoU
MDRATTLPANIGTIIRSSAHTSFSAMQTTHGRRSYATGEELKVDDALMY